MENHQGVTTGSPRRTPVEISNGILILIRPFPERSLVIGSAGRIRRSVGHRPIERVPGLIFYGGLSHVCADDPLDVVVRGAGRTSRLRHLLLHLIA